MDITVKTKGRVPSNDKAFARILATPKGEFIIIKNREWKLKTPVGSHIIRKYIKIETKIETLANDLGWKVTIL